MTLDHARTATASKARAWTSIPSIVIVKHALRRALILFVLFVAIYGSTNWITSLRNDRLRLWFEWELAIPPIPWMAWPYLSLVAAFFMPMFTLGKAEIDALCRRLATATMVSGVCFLLVPAELGFARQAWVAEREITFRLIHTLDLPHNLMPSLRVSWSLILLITLLATCTPAVRRLFELWLVLVLASVVLTHQHHVLDVLGGILVAFVCFVTVRGDGSWAAWGRNR